MTEQTHSCISSRPGKHSTAFATRCSPVGISVCSFSLFISLSLSLSRYLTIYLSFSLAFYLSICLSRPCRARSHFISLHSTLPFSLSLSLLSPCLLLLLCPPLDFLRCAHCKAFEAVFHAVASVLAGDQLVEIFRLDASKNDIRHPRVSLNAYPAFYFFAAGDKANPIEYDGERSVDAILKFIDTFRRTKARSQPPPPPQPIVVDESSSTEYYDENDQWLGPKQREDPT
jgi:Thioredoxin